MPKQTTQRPQTSRIERERIDRLDNISGLTAAQKEQIATALDAPTTAEQERARRKIFVALTAFALTAGIEDTMTIAEARTLCEPPAEDIPTMEDTTR